MANPHAHDGPTEDRFASGDLFRLLCEHAGVALIATDKDLKIQFWNAGAGRIFGAAASPMVGTPMLSILPAQNRAAAEKILRASITHHEISEFEFDQRDQKGELGHFSASISPLVNDEDHTLGTAIWVRDITRRTRLHKEVAHGRKMSALGEMAGAISHYFNNILGGLVTSIDFAITTGIPQIEHKTLVQAARSLGRAARLVQNLLAFAEGDHRSEDQADLTEVLLFAIDAVEPDLGAAGVELKLDISPVPVTAVPRKQFMTAILNIMHNAKDAMPSGGRLSVALETRDQECVARIEDTGVGMAENELERIFEPFYSTKTLPDNPEDRAPGLGLAVAHGIIQECGGHILVKSIVGEGSVFEISIPFGTTPNR